VHRDRPAGRFHIPVIALKVQGEVEVLDGETFAVVAKTAKETCSISKALGASARSPLTWRSSSDPPVPSTW
jgi:organic hydroperoxide reductase OsmC/OhrA